MPEEIDVLIEGNALQVKRMEHASLTLCQWFDFELGKLHDQMPVSYGGLLMGCPIWGEAYIERLARYSLPSLGEERNLAALAGKSAMVFYCLQSDRPLLWKITRWMRQAGIKVMFRIIPPEVMAELSKMPEDKYGILSTVQNLLAHMAGHADMGLHMYMIDHLYCAGYFENLAKMGGKHDAIIQQGCSVDVEAAAEDIEKYRDRDANFLTIPPRDLGGITLKHMHLRTSRTIMNNLDFPNIFPRSHQATWIGKNAIHMASAPQNIAWLSPQLCQDAPIAFTSTMDMLPCEYIPPGVEYMAGADDGLVFCELSDPKRIPPDGYGDFRQFNYRHHAQVGFTNDYSAYFRKRCLIPIPEQEDFMCMSDDEIAKQHEWIIRGLDEGATTAMQSFFRGQCPARWPAEEAQPLKEAADD